MRRAGRIATALVLLLVVAVATWQAKRRIASWDVPLRAVVYPIAGDDSPVDPRLHDPNGWPRLPPSRYTPRGMRTLDDELRSTIAGFPGVLLAYLFGSAAQGLQRRSSDLDVAVLFASRPTLDQIGELTGALELVGHRRVDLVDLATAPPLLLREVIVTGRLLWARSEDDRIAFETRSLARYVDTARLRRVQHVHLHEWAERHRAGER